LADYLRANAALQRERADFAEQLAQPVQPMAALNEAALDLYASLADMQRRIHDARKHGRATRIRAVWVNPLTIAGLGLGIGVVAAQLLQDYSADIHPLLPWLVAVGAWGILDYVMEPWLRRLLARRQLKNMLTEVSESFAAWKEFSARRDGTPPVLPRWDLFRPLTAGLPPPTSFVL
jgi:hypothetical protein